MFEEAFPIGLVLIGLVLIGGFFYLIIEGISPAQHNPLSPDEEADWLRNSCGLTDDEIDEYQHGPKV